MSCWRARAPPRSSRFTASCSIRFVPRRPPCTACERSADPTASAEQTPSPTNSSPILGLLGDADLLAEIHVLDRLEERDPLLLWPLERLAAADEPHAARALVDDRRLHRLDHVVVARRPAAVDEPDPPHVAVHDLIAGEIDRVIRRQL